MRTQVVVAAVFTALAVSSCVVFNGLGLPEGDAGALDGTPPKCALSQGGLESDAENCGACGRVCESGQCNGGICVPKAIFQGKDLIGEIDANDTEVAWRVLPNRVFHTQLANLDAAEEVKIAEADPISAVQGLILIPSSTYYLVVSADGATKGTGAIFGVKRDGTSITLSNNSYHAEHLRRQGVALFTSRPTYDIIGECTCGASCDCRDHAGIVEDQFTTTDNRIYWFDPTRRLLACNRDVNDCAKGRTIVDDVHTTESLRALAGDGDLVAWSVQSEGNVYVCRERSTATSDAGVLGCEPRLLATGQSSPNAVHADRAAGRISWLTLSGTLASCPADGCPDAGPTLHARGLTAPRGLVKSKSSFIVIDRDVDLVQVPIF